MKKLIIGFISLVLVLATVPCLAQEGSDHKSAVSGSDIVKRADLGYKPDGMYGPFQITWVEYYSFGGVVVVFDNGDFLDLSNSLGYNCEAIAQMALSAWNGSRSVLVYITNSRLESIRFKANTSQ